MEFDWTLLIGIATVLVTNLLTIITLYIHLDNKTENRLANMQNMINEWKRISDNEMRDFHGKLCEIAAKQQANG